MKEVATWILRLIGQLIAVFLLGAIVLFVLSAGGEAVDKYIYPRTTWQVWIAYVVVGGFIYYIYTELKNNNKD